MQMIVGIFEYPIVVVDRMQPQEAKYHHAMILHKRERGIQGRLVRVGD